MSKVARLLASVALLISAGCATHKPAAPPKFFATKADATESPLPCETQEQAFRGLWKAHDPAATNAALARLIENCPASVVGLLRIRISRMLYETGADEGQAENNYKILGALFDIGWTAETELESDYKWLVLTQMHIEHGNFELAKRVSTRINEPGNLLEMRVDRMFDGLISADPAHFDIPTAIERKVERLRSAAVSAPRSLAAWIEYVQAVTQAGRYAQSLNLVSEAIERGATGYDDYVEQYPWLLTAKSAPLLYSGRMDESLDALTAADQAGVGTRRAVSFAINLADAQERAGRAADALATFTKVGETSDYGSLVVQVGIANAARQTGDLARAEEALKKAGEYRWQDTRLYLSALIRAGRVNEAKLFLLQLLDLPYWRSRTLADMQNYRQHPLQTGEADELTRLHELLSLPDVREAILRVGRIETFDFPPQ